MTVLDPSVIVALMTREAGWEHWRAVLEDADDIAIGAPSLVELSIVVEAQLGAEGLLLMHRLLARLGVMIEPFGPEHADAAIDAWRRFGKGRHPAALNFGDCLSYAAAHVRADRLAYVGHDFDLTDMAHVDVDPPDHP